MHKEKPVFRFEGKKQSLPILHTHFRAPYISKIEKRLRTAAVSIGIKFKKFFCLFLKNSLMYVFFKFQQIRGQCSKAVFRDNIKIPHVNYCSLNKSKCYKVVICHFFINLCKSRAFLYCIIQQSRMWLAIYPFYFVLFGCLHAVDFVSCVWLGYLKIEKLHE